LLKSDNSLKNIGAIHIIRDTFGGGGKRLERRKGKMSLDIFSPGGGGPAIVIK